MEENYQQKLAASLNALDTKLKNAFLLERKRHGIHTNTLAAAIRTHEALRDACITMTKCLTTEEDREDFAKRMTEHLV